MNSNLIIFLIIAAIVVALLLVVVITVIVAVVIHKRQQQNNETVTMKQVAMPLNTIEKLKEEGIYEKIDDCSDKKDTSLQETTKVKPQIPTKEAESLSPVMMKENVVYGAAAAAGYGGGVAPVAMMKNTSYDTVGAGNINVGEMRENEIVNIQTPPLLPRDVPVAMMKNASYDIVGAGNVNVGEMRENEIVNTQLANPADGQ